MPEAIGGYELLAPLGKGAMGEVWSAVKPAMADPVALKVMAAALGGDPELVERFRREAMAASRVDHPNITRGFEFGEDGGRLFMAMELLDGHDLGTLTRVLHDHLARDEFVRARGSRREEARG